MIPTHLVFKWFPNWTRDRIRWWFETTSFAFVSGWFGIAVGGRPRYVMVRLLLIFLLFSFVLICISDF